MQIYTWDTKGFESAYSKNYYKLRGCGAIHRKSCSCDDSTITYSRPFFLQDDIFKIRAESIINQLNLQPGSDIMVIGCAFGYLMEEFHARGMNVWGCDNSKYIQTNKSTKREDVKFPIHNISVLDSDFYKQVQKWTGAAWFDVVITEDVLTSHDEYSSIFSNCESILNPEVDKRNIVHLVDLNTREPFIARSYSEWKALKPEHTWVDSFGKSE